MAWELVVMKMQWDQAGLAQVAAAQLEKTVMIEYFRLCWNFKLKFLKIVEIEIFQKMKNENKNK